MKYNTVFMYGTYAYDTYKYDSKYNVELARRIARWHAKLKHWHVVWHVGT